MTFPILTSTPCAMPQNAHRHFLRVLHPTTPPFLIVEWPSETMKCPHPTPCPTTPPPRPVAVNVPLEFLCQDLDHHKQEIPCANSWGDILRKYRGQESFCSPISIYPRMSIACSQGSGDGSVKRCGKRLIVVMLVLSVILIRFPDV